MWFEKLMGFTEESPQQVRELLKVEHETLTSSINGKSSWIIDAIRKTMAKFANTPLNVKIVSYGAPDPVVGELIQGDWN